MPSRRKLIALALCLVTLVAPACYAAPKDSDWEITPDSERALDRGLKWLTANQGSDGNWGSNDLGLVSMGTLAYLAAGHTPGRGKEYGPAVERSLSFILKKAKPSGLLNISDGQRDMYNHGLSTFVLGQAYGMSNDQRIGPVLDRALKLIAATQCKDGGWDYRAASQERGHDLSLVVMQAKALRSAVDSGLEVSPEVTDAAIKTVREHYTPRGGRSAGTDVKKEPGQFTYNAGGQGTTAMAAAGVVCLQEFGQYDDWRIAKSMEYVTMRIKNKDDLDKFDAYTLYYVAQALYQVGGKDWRECYPILRDHLVAKQIRSSERASDGKWTGEHRVGGLPGELYITSVSCFVLAIPNRYLPILQEGKIGSLNSAAAAKP